MNKHTLSNELSILFLSCDKYQDVWRPLFSQFWKCWIDCPYDLFLGSNTKKYEDTKIKTILSGPDKDWSTSLLNILAQIKTPYIFLWLDDIFPVSQIKTESFRRALALMKDKLAVHVHIRPMPVPEATAVDSLFGTYPKGMPYRVNALGFWNVAYLKSLLLAGETPWNFEIMGSYRSMYTDGFFCFLTPVFETIHAIEKGKFFPEAITECKKHGIPIDTTKRQTLEVKNRIKSKIQIVIFNIMMSIPWRTRVNIMNMARKLFISY